MAAPLLAVLLCACAWWNQQVSPQTRSQVENQAYPGMQMAEAEANLQAIGYDCSQRTGSYFDEQGKEHAADAFLSCVKRPGTVSFYCNERTHVVLVPDGQKVARVEVVSSPSCYRNK